MSALFNQTNIASYTTNFITRKEVADGFSTLAGDLSGVNFSTLFVNPNPVVSTLTVNPSGSISLPGSINTSALSVSSIGGLTPCSAGTGFNKVAVTDNTGNNFGNLFAQSFNAQQGSKNTVGNTLSYMSGAISGTTSNLATQPFMVWNPSNPAGTNFTLANVSTINGIVPGTGMTTFTSLTGSNLTTTGTLTSPQIVSVSSINGVPYSAVYNGTWNGTQSVSLNSNVVGVLASINLPAGYLQPNQTYIYDVPIVFTSIPPGQATGFLTNIGIRLGNNGQINYQIPFYILNSSQGFPINLTGIAQTNTTTVGSQQIQILGLQAGTPTFTATWSAPTSAGGLNVFSIKPLS